MTIVDRNYNTIAVKISTAEIPPGLNFYSDDNDFLQVGSWRYEKGKKLLAHVHNSAPRQIERTQEFVYVVKGSLAAKLYDAEENFIQDVTVKAGEALILLSGGHGYEILEEDTVVVEVKNGPYVGAELDRRRIEV